ncbi:hypothetical protein MKX03_005566, partial [Papaver bracteatum]
IKYQEEVRLCEHSESLAAAAKGETIRLVEELNDISQSLFELENELEKKSELLKSELEDLKQQLKK